MDNDLFKAFRFIPVIKDYSWGSCENIQRITGNLQGIGKPAAELWMGSHPGGTGSVVIDNNRTMLLSDFISADPEFVLGVKTCRKFNKNLPFLFKILSAEKPLSIQAHPDKKQAEDGFSRENKAEIKIESFQRNYKDSSHKPELLYALTDFTMMKGFRSFETIIHNIKSYCPDSGRFLMENKKTLKDLFSSIFKIEQDQLIRIIDEAVSSSGKKNNNHAISSLILMFYDIYKNDPGVLSPLFLNIYTLNPDEAVFIPAGELHAYIKGTGFEIMANSDNVLRGGLTDKHVDYNELMKILDSSSSGAGKVIPVTYDNKKIYKTEAEEFLFSEIALSDNNIYCAADGKSFEIYFCLTGTCKIEAEMNASALKISKGESFIIPAGVFPYNIKGNARLFKAEVNI